ncbi:hypothetical protein [Bradyrhizobium icense]|uniref:hypothetical protein n=1 Tax=Bradyrhizobium icense TaxID=1274631 RepID=UPI0012EA1D25|nr:hypothetical protein [Bradyrhizobium icense]
MHDLLTWLLVGEHRVTALTARGSSAEEMTSSVSDPDRSSPPAPRAGSQLRFNSAKQAELKSGQWCLLAPLQAGNKIKFAMFRRRASLNALFR